jgi:hypothetical protein
LFLLLKELNEALFFIQSYFFKSQSQCEYISGRCLWLEPLQLTKFWWCIFLFYLSICSQCILIRSTPPIILPHPPSHSLLRTISTGFIVFFSPCYTHWYPLLAQYLFYLPVFFFFIYIVKGSSLWYFTHVYITLYSD